MLTPLFCFVFNWSVVSYKILHEKYFALSGYLGHKTPNQAKSRLFMCEWMSQCISSLGEMIYLIFGTMFNVIFDKCVPRQSFGQLDQCKKDRIVWDTQNLKSGEKSSLLIHEVQKKDFHWEIEIKRVNIKNK